MTRNEMIRILRANTYKDKDGNAVVPFKVALSIVDALFKVESKSEETPMTKKRIIKNYKELNMMHKHQVFNGCKVVFYSDRAEICSIFNRAMHVLYKKRYKNLDNFKKAVIKKTMEIGKKNSGFPFY